MTILQSLLKSAKPAQAPERIERQSDPIATRRSKFLHALSDQIALLNDPDFRKQTYKQRKSGEAGTRKLRSWYSSGLLVPMYGRAALAFAPGKTALNVDKNKVGDVLKQLGEACAAGELDAMLATAAESVKPKRKSGKKAASKASAQA